MSWKDVPMPARIAALPKDKRGFPVPWVSEWSTPEDERGERSWHESMTEAYHVALTSCTHVDGQGEPDLGNLCAVRQIAGMHHRLCDVCGGKVKRTAWFMGSQFRNDEDGTTGFRETPMHLECVLYAGQVCPGMVTKAPGQIHVVQTQHYALVQERMLRREQVPPTAAISSHDFNNDIVNAIFSPDDESWKYLQPVSVLLGLVAVPVGDYKQWPLEEFLYNHGVKHPYHPWPR